MKKVFSFVALVVVILLLVLAWRPLSQATATTGDQILLGMRWVSGGAQAKGANVLQVGEVSTLSAAVSDVTLTEVVAAPTAGSIYLRGLLVEKSTGAGGTITLQTGTGTNCGTGGAVLLGP